MSEISFDTLGNLHICKRLKITVNIIKKMKELISPTWAKFWIAEVLSAACVTICKYYHET